MKDRRNQKNPTSDLNLALMNKGAGPSLSLLCLDGLDKILANNLEGKEGKVKGVRESEKETVLLWLSVDSHAWI